MFERGLRLLRLGLWRRPGLTGLLEPKLAGQRRSALTSRHRPGQAVEHWLEEYHWFEEQVQWHSEPRLAPHNPVLKAQRWLKLAGQERLGRQGCRQLVRQPGLVPR